MTKEQTLLEEFYYTMKSYIESDFKDVEKGQRLLQKYENLCEQSLNQALQNWPELPTHS